MQPTVVLQYHVIKKTSLDVNIDVTMIELAMGEDAVYNAVNLMKLA